MKMIKSIFISILIIHAVVSNENKTVDYYGPSELTSKSYSHHHLASTSRRSTGGLVKFENQYNLVEQSYQQHNNRVTFDGESSSMPLKFDNTDSVGSPDVLNINIGHKNIDDNEDNQIAFQDDNRLENQTSQQKKRRRRRRRPKQQSSQYPTQGNYGLLNPAGPVGVLGENNPAYIPGYSGLPMDQSNVYPGYPFAQRPTYAGSPHAAAAQLYNPPRRPRPSAASAALSAVTRALSSIALYDDYQCVPRLLCEAAAGGALGAGSAGLLQSVAGLQPLLTLLSTYNGISTSPLFVFGRAVFLGMVSKANPGTCRYAYSLCPTDPEQLVHYLNNHNGGFFRFFSAPELDNTQHHHNLEQFYNQLTVPGQYGLLSNNLGSETQNYGIHRPYTGDIQQPEPPGSVLGSQSYGVHSNLANQQSSNYNPHTLNHGYGYAPQQNFISYKQINSQYNKDEDTNINNNRIQKRIQNINHDAFTDHFYSKPSKKWQFPENLGVTHDEDRNKKIRNEKQLKFYPDDNIDAQIDNQAYSSKKVNGFTFPGIQSNREYLQNDRYPFISSIDNWDFVNVGAINHVNPDNGTADEETLYVIRGNGDPNYPEIVKVKKGQYYV